MRITYKTKRLLSLINEINMAKHYLENGEMEKLNTSIIQYEKLLKIYFDIYKYNYVNLGIYEKLSINYHIYFIYINSGPLLEINNVSRQATGHSKEKFIKMMRSVDILMEVTYFFGFSHWLATKNIIRTASSLHADMKYVSTFKKEIKSKRLFPTCRAEEDRDDKTVSKFSFFRPNPLYIYDDLLTFTQSIKRAQASKVLHQLFQEATTPTSTEAFVTAMAEIISPSSSSLWELSDLGEILTSLSEAIFTFSLRIKEKIMLEDAMTTERLQIYPRIEAAFEYVENVVTEVKNAISATAALASATPSLSLDRCLTTAESACAEAKSAEQRADMQWVHVLNSETLEALRAAGAQAEQEASIAIFAANRATRALSKAQATAGIRLALSSSSSFTPLRDKPAASSNANTLPEASRSYIP